MSTSSTCQVIQYLRRVLVQDAAGLTDDQLLARFIDQQDEAAIAALVKRHSGLIWGVCRRILDHHSAEDAFQATFLVLVRKASTIRRRDRLASWLYGVANQTAMQARRNAARRRGREKQVVNLPEVPTREQDLWNDLRPVLDQELNCLPESYRIVLLLSTLEGKTRKEVARQLGLPEGTVASRLSRARAMLARRLARHGLGVSTGALAVALSHQAASARVPPLVLSSTIKTASLLATRPGVAAGLISTHVVQLVEGVVSAMMLTKLKAGTFAILACLSLVCIGGSFWTAAGQPAESENGPSKPGPRAAVAKDYADQDGGSGGSLILQPGDYRRFFVKTLGVIAEHFEVINEANAYSGRIDALKPCVGTTTATEKASVVIQRLDDGPFSVWIRIEKITGKAPNVISVRDRDLENKILERLQARPALRTGASDRSASLLPAIEPSSAQPEAREDNIEIAWSGRRAIVKGVSRDKQFYAEADQANYDGGKRVLLLKGDVSMEFRHPGHPSSLIKGESVLYNTASGKLQVDGRKTIIQKSEAPGKQGGTRARLNPSSDVIPPATSMGREQSKPVSQSPKAALSSEQQKKARPTGPSPLTPAYVVEPPDVLALEVVGLPEGSQPVRGFYSVRPDGTIPLGGNYGSLAVAGHSLDAIRTLIVDHLARSGKSNKLSVHVVLAEQKSPARCYYVIHKSMDKGDNVYRVLDTGGETVVGAILRIAGLADRARAGKVWLAEPGSREILEVNWRAITQDNNTETNYVIRAGDRVFIEDRPSKPAK